jgi:hypothetical protein
VKRANLPDPEDYDAKLEAITVCQTLELGMNQLHEAICALYMKHTYNQAVVDNFFGDEYVWVERKQPLKERMANSVKEVQKLIAQAKAATRNAGGSFGGKRKKRIKGGDKWKQPAKQGSSLLVGFDKPKPASGCN